MKTTVYKVTFPNGKVYIGITTKSFDRRKIQHFSAAKMKSTYKFHRALNKYNQGIIWEIIAILDSWEDASKLEIALIKQYDSFKTGYNATTGGEGTPGRKMSRAQKQHIAVGRGTAKPVFVFDLQGIFIKEFSSQSDCACHFSELGIQMDVRNISSCIKGRKRCCYGFVFSSVKEFILKDRKSKGIPIKIIFENGKEEIVRSLDIAAKKLRISKPTLLQRLKNKLPLKTGSTIEYASEISSTDKNASRQKMGRSLRK